MSLLWRAYRGATALAGALAPAAGALVGRKEGLWWGERLGREIPIEGPVDAWIHAASLGEGVAARALRDALRAHRPQARFLFTATTRTGRERLSGLGGLAALAPLDTPQAAAAFFGSVRPARLFLVETELWPRWLLRARRLVVPVAVVSARLSARSAKAYGWLGEPFRALVGGLGAVLCQTEEDGERWRALGARHDRVQVVGNLKFDALPEPAQDRGAARAGQGLDPARPLLVLASLRPTEARMLARAWNAQTPATRERWQVVAVPRHPHRSRAIRVEAEEAGVTVMIDGGVPAPPGVWRWDDRPGILAGYYAGADVAFVGGSLAPLGGHNPLEPAAAGAAVLVGPHTDAQAPAMALLAGASAVTIADEATLAAALARLLEDDGERCRRAEAGLAAARGARGAARRAALLLEEWGLWPPP